MSNGDSPLIVWTSDTGIRDVASALRMWPPIWKQVNGRVARIRSLEGGRMPYFRKGRVCFKRGYLRANMARIRHQLDTKANCTQVRVTGRGRAVRIAFEDMLVMMEVMYHTPQSSYTWYVSISNPPCEIHIFTYYKFWRQRCLERIGELMRILADASLPRPYRPKRLAQALLPSMPVRAKS